MERHSILRDEFVYARPPIELAHRRRIPSVAVRMVGVSDPRRKIIFGERAAQTRHILVRLFGRAAKGVQDALYQLLCSGVMDIIWFQHRKDFDASFDSQALMCALRIER